MDRGQLKALFLGERPGHLLGPGLADAIGPGKLHALKFGEMLFGIDALAAGVALPVADRGDRRGQDHPLDPGLGREAQHPARASDRRPDHHIGIPGLDGEDLRRHMHYRVDAHHGIGPARIVHQITCAKL